MIKTNEIQITNMPELPYAIEEAVNRLRINISFLGSDVKKIMLISSEPNEGKSFVSMQLWHQMAKMGVKSCFVDADLRNSVTTSKYGIQRTDGKPVIGTSQYLAGEYSLEDVLLHEAGNPESALLPNVENTVNPSMLIEGKRFEKLLDELAENYRYVFVDAPPLNLVSDGERMGNLCDGAVLCVRSGVTSKAVVKNSIRQLERANCPLLGVVLNRVEGSSGGYYSKHYGKYYGGKYGKYYGSKYYGGEYYGKH
jgi:capsular exopolysaccharide synthesis family protein